MLKAFAAPRRSKTEPASETISCAWSAKKNEPRRRRPTWFPFPIEYLEIGYQASDRKYFDPNIRLGDDDRALPRVERSIIPPVSESMLDPRFRSPSPD